MLLYIVAIEVLANFTNTDKISKEIQKREHEIKNSKFLLTIPPSSYEILPALIGYK